MAVAATPAERNRARALRRNGHKLKEIADVIGRHHSVVQKWCVGIKPGISEGKIAWDPFDKCWRIYVRDIDRDPTIKKTTAWWPLAWLRFASCHVAEEHLARYGEKWGVEA